MKFPKKPDLVRCSRKQLVNYELELRAFQRFEVPYMGRHASIRCWEELSRVQAEKLRRGIQLELPL